MPIQNESPEPNESPTLRDLADSTREITERVDSQTEAVRFDLASRTETVREQVVDSTQAAKAALADKTEATRKDLADRTEAVRVDLAERTETIRLQVVEATHQAKRDVEDKTEVTRTELETKYEVRKVSIDRKFWAYRTWFIFAVVIMSLSNTLLYYLFLHPGAGYSVFEIGEVVVVGGTDLCPGDSLRFRINAQVLEPGVYQLAMSTWKTLPLPATNVFSEGLDMVMAEAREFPIEIEWTIPYTYKSLATGKETRWSSGSYSRDIAVTAIGRNTRASTRKVPFKIRPNC